MNFYEAQKVYARVQPGDLRELARRDLYFLLRYVLKRADMEHPWIYERCRQVQGAPDGYLDLWAREHYKSTIITFGLTIQNILCDPEITVGIFSHTRSIAKDFLNQIKREFESNVLLNELFPDILWGVGKRGAVSWSENDGLVVRRRSNPKEATVEAWGLVDGQPTGKHFRLLIYDDTVTRESVSTPDQIAKVTAAWELSLNLGAHGGKRRYIGTRYHFNDSYTEIMRRGAAIPRIHTATHDGTENGEPVFLTRAALLNKRREMGPYTFGCQMLQDPRADAVMGFEREWFQTATTPAESAWGAMNRYILVDPAGEKKKSNDYTVMWVIGLGVDRNYRVLDGVYDRLNLRERTESLFDLHRKWHPLMIGYEKYSMQSDIEHIKEVMDWESYHFPIQPLGGPMPKNDRIRRLVPLFEDGRVFFPHQLLYRTSEGPMVDLSLCFFNDEFMTFPVSAHDDMLDCLARIVEADLGAVFPTDGGERASKSIQRNSLRRRYLCVWEEGAVAPRNRLSRPRWPPWWWPPLRRTARPKRRGTMSAAAGRPLPGAVIPI